MSRGPFRVVQRAIVEAGRLGVRYWWVALVSLWFLPALLLSNVLLGWVSTANWSCTSVEFGASGSQYGGCSVIAGELIVAVAISWLVPLSVLATLLYLRRRRSHGVAGDRGARSPATRTGTFVRVGAVLTGLGNALVISDPFDAVAAPAERPLATFVGMLLLSIPVGLAASGIVLRWGRSAFDGGFLARYGVAVLGLCLGGAILGGSSWVLGVMLNYEPGPPQSSESGIFFLLYATLAYGSVAALVGGVLGLLEGLVLGLPLAAVLGWLRRPPRSQGHGTSFPDTARP